MKRAASGPPIWPCTRWGFPCPPDHSRGGGLLPRLFTLTPTEISNPRFETAGGAVCFLWHCPSDPSHDGPARVYTCLRSTYADPRRAYAASRPWVFGLSSPPPKRRSDPPPFQNHGEPNRGRGRLAMANPGFPSPCPPYLRGSSYKSEAYVYLSLGIAKLP